MRVQVELDADGELLIHARGCRTADPALVVPPLTAAVVAAIQRCRAGQPMPVAAPADTEQLRARMRRLEEDLVAADAVVERAEQRHSELRAQLVAAERREGKLRVERDDLARQREHDRETYAALAAGWPEKLRAAEETGAAHAARAEQLQHQVAVAKAGRTEAREQTRAVRLELAAVTARAEQAEHVLTEQSGTRDGVEVQAVQRRVALALLDEGRSAGDVAALVGASLGLVRRWEATGG